MTDNPPSPFKLAHYSHAKRAIALIQNARMGQSVYPVPERLTEFVFDAATANTALIGLARFGEPFAPSLAPVCASASLCLPARASAAVVLPPASLASVVVRAQQAGRQTGSSRQASTCVACFYDPAVCGGGDGRGQRQQARMKIGKRAATARAYVRE